MINSRASLVQKMVSRTALSSKVDMVRNFQEKVVKKNLSLVNVVQSLKHEVKQSLHKNNVNSLKNIKDFVNHLKTVQNKELLRNLSVLDTLQSTSGQRFIFACKLGQSQHIRKMLAEEPNHVFSKDHLKQTGLHWAVKRGHIEAIQLLIEAKSFIDSKDICGFTPLYYAISEGRFEVGRYLLEKGACPWSNEGYDLV